MNYAKDGYYSTVTKDSCQFCGKRNQADLSSCVKCGDWYCPDCISYSVPQSTFPTSNFGAGHYCYRCLDQIIQSHNNPLTEKLWQVFGISGTFLWMPLKKGWQSIKEVMPKISWPPIFKMLTQSNLFIELNNSVSKTWQGLMPNQKAKLIGKIILFILGYTALNIYLAIPILETIRLKTSILTAILFGCLFIYVIGLWVIRHDRDGVLRQLVGHKMAILYGALMIFLISAPWMHGLIEFLVRLILNIINMVINMLGLSSFGDYFSGYKKISLDLWQNFKAIISSVQKNAFKIP